MPITDEPFRCIAMDVVGPLPKTRKRNQYILVVCDYATRYPEAIPLRTFTAPVVAEKLIEIFSILDSPGNLHVTNFTSQLLHELYKLLGVKVIKTSPNHPQTNGLGERFNQTLKSMLIYSRDVRGPLDVLKESWSSDEKEMDDILTYVMKTRERMELAS